uniref:Uncharacterized protein n=1 Tax=Panagrolaimus sp. ES5 TaxID=591445 RepID=A0AC34F6W7_9BILA
MQSINNSNKCEKIVIFNGQLEFGTGRILLDQKSLVEYPTPAILIATKESTSFFSCQECFEDKQNAFIKSRGKGIDAYKIVRLFVDKSGFCIYLETHQRYIFLRRAVHVEIGNHTLQVIITDYDGHYFGILVWIYDIKIGQNTGLIHNFYRQLCYRLLVSFF